jgi:predicted transcriptional regulator
MWEGIIISRLEIDDGNQRRSRMDVISSILEAATNDSKKTRIMYRATLNFKQMKRYLPLLIRRGLLEKVQTESSRSLYKTTQKGLDFLKKYDELSNI